MKTKLSLYTIGFLLFFSFHLQGQTFENTCWINLGRSDLAICFLNSDTIQIENLQTKNSRKYGMKVAFPFLIISENSKVFDSLEIIEEKTTQLILQAKTSRKVFNLTREKTIYSEEQVQSILNGNNLKISNYDYNYDMPPYYLIQDTTNREIDFSRSCFKHFEYTIKMESYGTTVNFQGNPKMLITKLMKNRLLGLDLRSGDKVIVEILVKKKHQKNVNRNKLIGSYILYRNHEKLKKGLKEGDNTIHIGYSAVDLRDDNTFTFNYIEKDRNGILEGSWKLVRLDNLEWMRLEAKGMINNSPIEFTNHYYIKSQDKKHLILDLSYCSNHYSYYFFDFFLKK